MNLSKLEKIHQDVNFDVEYKSDLEHYGKSDHWTLPFDGLGDCEDYALMKKKLLLDAGWSKESLRLATCWVEDDLGYHAVLVVVDGDIWWVLDNREKHVRLWSRMRHYKWHKMQDENGVWRSVS